VAFMTFPAPVADPSVAAAQKIKDCHYTGGGCGLLAAAAAVAAVAARVRI
jgi:hypothetical protein